MAQDVREKRMFTYSLSYEEIDAVNRRVLEELLQDPRLTMSELGRRVGMSSPAVTERVRRLEETGVIRGYRLELNPVALGLPIAAYVRILCWLLRISVPKSASQMTLSGLFRSIYAANRWPFISTIVR